MCRTELRNCRVLGKGALGCNEQAMRNPTLSMTVPVLSLSRHSPIVTRSSICLEAPKSATLTRPVVSTRMLAPLMSRCMMPLLCKYSRPSRIWRVYTRITLSLKLPARPSGTPE